MKNYSEIFIKAFLIVITILALLWIIALLKIVNRNVSFKMEPQVCLGKTLTSMNIIDTVTNIHINQGDTLNIMYYLINTGRDSLFVNTVNPDCSCTDYVINANKSAPGDTIKLELIVDTSNKYGYNLIRVVLGTNTKEEMDMIRLPFCVESECEFQATSDSLVAKRHFKFRKLQVGKEKEVNSFITNNTSDDLYIDMMTSCDCIDVRPRRLRVKAGSRSDYKLIIKPRIEGPYSEHVLMRVIETGQILKITVEGIVK